jgi:rubrerythrin
MEIDIDGGEIMADWVCKKCGYVRDSRCKPKKCPNCDAQDAFEKKEESKKP